MERIIGLNTPTILLCLIASFLALTSVSSAQNETIPFSPDRWVLDGAETITHLGRDSLIGAAIVKDVEFENGVIEVDVAVDGSRSYPGLIFRMQSNENMERVYIRPHRAGLYPDAVQYMPQINGSETWQLYSGDGFTSGAAFNEEEWNHLRLEVHGSQARLFLNNGAEPILKIHDLKHAKSRGQIGLYGPKDRSACFSNFRYRIDDTLTFEPPPEVKPHPWSVGEWEISRAFPANRIDMASYPPFGLIFSAGWRAVEADSSGLLDISRHARRTNSAGDCVLTRTVFGADRKGRIELSFGYSDKVAIFHNGKLVFFGDYTYRSREPSFVGVVGLHDTIVLDAPRGRNEILFILSETFGGWGLTARADRYLPPAAEDRVQKVWETDPLFLTPESVLYDEERDILYVTNLDVAWESKREPSGFISRVQLNGEVDELHWITGLRAPCGMAIHDNSLFVVERHNLVEIDLVAGEIAKKHAVRGSTFLNDVAADAAGTIYMSDSFPPDPKKTAVIYALEKGVVSVWLDTDRLGRVNGLRVLGNTLLVGNSEDSSLKSIDLETKAISHVASLGAGIVDGIRERRDGSTLVSHWEGQTYQISPTGQVVEIMDTLADGQNSADFEFIDEMDLLIMPTFLGNRVAAYLVKGG